jgi:hypothetical protein
VVEDDTNTCQEGGGVADTLLLAVWWFRPQNQRWTVFGFEPQNLSAVPVGIEGNTGRHHEACNEVKAKL